MHVYWIYFLAIIPSLVSSGLMIQRYFRTKVRHYLYMALNWTCLGLWSFFHAIGNLFVSPFLGKMVMIIFIPCGYLTALLIDSFNRDRPDNLKIIIITILATGLVYSCCDSQSIIIHNIPDGHNMLDITGEFKLWTIFYTGFVTSLLIFYFGKIVLQSKIFLQQISIYLLAGTICYATVPVIVATGAYYQVVIGFDAIMVAMGTLSVTVAFIREPKLAYVLPFKALNLTVIHKASGLSIYSHTWIKKHRVKNTTIFSGVVKGLTTILQTSLDQGDIREIKLDQGELLLYESPDFPIVCALVSKKTTQSLRDALQSFGQKFVQQYQDHLQDPGFLESFQSADHLIAEAFPFVPNQQ